MPKLEPPPLTKEHRNRIDDGVIARVMLERRILWNLIHYLLADDFLPEWSDVGEGPEPARTPAKMFEEATSVDEARIGFRKRGETKTHGVLLVFGNSGIDLISDWSHSPDDGDGFNAAMDKFNPEDYL